MAVVIEIAGNVFNPVNLASIIVWPGVTGPRYGTHKTFIGRSIGDGAGFSEGDWSAAINAAKVLADRRRVPIVYVARNLRA